MIIQMFGLSERGSVRELNEDGFWYDPDLGTAIVADGLGGPASGEVASSIAVRAFRETMLSSLPLASVPDDLRHIMASAIGYANREILADIAEHSYRKGMATTMVCFTIRGNTFVAAHVGDSRAYCIRAGQIAPLTRDHSYVMELVEYGVISEAEAAIHPQRNLITRVVGGAEGAEADFTIFPAELDDRYLLCSDGLHGVLTEGEICDAIVQAESLEAACAALINRTMEAGAPDNVTIVLARVVSLDPEQPKTPKMIG